MNSQLQQAIQIVRSLSSTEQLQLLQVLSVIVKKTDFFEEQNKYFLESRSIDELIEEQQPPIVSDISSLGVDFWDSDESNDEFLSFLYQQRSVDSPETP
jgi:hypothetical protein